MLTVTVDRATAASAQTIPNVLTEDDAVRIAQGSQSVVPALYLRFGSRVPERA
jgi:hypothetical protein